MADEPRITTDHDEIRHWTERHGGEPAVIRADSVARDPGELRLKFSERESPSLATVSWETFFRDFDARGLALLYDPDEGPDVDAPLHRFVNRNESFDAQTKPIDQTGPVVPPL